MVQQSLPVCPLAAAKCNGVTLGVQSVCMFPPYFKSKIKQSIAPTVAAT